MSESITHCYECTHCFESYRSRTGWACEVWGYEDFACDTVLDGFCHKAKPVQKMDFLWKLHVFKTEEEADAIISQIKSIYEWYGVVTKADIKEMLNIDTCFTDTKYGILGKPVEELQSIQLQLGWIIDYPRFVLIERKE